MASLDDVTPVTIIFTDDELAGILAVMPDDMAIEDWIKIQIMGLVGKAIMESEDE